MDQRAERLARGDPAAFAELYDACADRVQQFTVDLKETADEAPREESSNGSGSSREPRSPSC